MSPSALIAHPPLGLVQPARFVPAAIVAATSSRIRAATAQGQDHTALCWLVAIAASYLAIGIVGLFSPQGIVPITLSGAQGKGADLGPAIETTMAELQAQAEPVEMAVVETPPEAIEIPPVEFLEQLPMELPELTEALVTEDVFVVPAAPRIEEALKPVEPAEPKPVVKRTSSPSRPTSAPRTNANTVAGGGGDGNAAIGSGGRGMFPEPPYPSFARSRGMQGTCTLSIRVGPSGTVESVTVKSSTGFSDLDRHASSWVRRNWRWPLGGDRSFNLPISFRLR